MRYATLQVFFLFLAGISTTHAVPFYSADARSLGMGGTGVASGDFHNAPLYNPAFLGAPSRTRWFALGIPISLQIADPKGLINSAQDFKNNHYLSDFDSAVADFKNKRDTAVTTPIQPNIDALMVSKNNLASSIARLNDGFRSFSDKPAELGGTASLVVAIPGNHWGVALVENAWAAGGVIGDYAQSDANNLDNIVANLSAWDGTAATLPSLLAVAFTSQNVTSSITARGISVIETGVAFGKKQIWEGEEFYWGVTPKYQNITTFDVIYSSSTLLQLNTSAKDILNQNAREYRSINTDLGAGYIYNKQWRAGVVVKNLFPASYKTASGGNVKISPALRVGGAFQTDRFTAASDLDITENDPAGVGEKSRFFGLGAEVDAWVLKLRVGGRANLSNSKMNMLTAGLGLNLLGVHVDASGAYGRNAWAASLLAGLDF